MITNRNDYPLKPLKWYKALSTVKGRLESGTFIVEGDKAIQQIMGIRHDAIIEIVTVEKPPTPYLKYPIRMITESQFHSISSVRTPQGILAVVRIPEDIYSSQLPRDAGGKILLLEDIQDPGNVGTLIRTASAFDFSGIILTEKCADPFSSKCIQATAGSILSVWLRRTNSYLELAKLLEKNGYALIAADIDGMEEPSMVSHHKKLVLALGNEASGLSKEVLDAAGYGVRIPVARDKAESLNVAISGAILMYLTL